MTFKYSSPASVRTRYVVAALIVLAVSSLNCWILMVERVIGNDQCRWTDVGASRLLITEIVSGGVADRAGLRNGDHLLAINGIGFKKATDAQLIINRNAGTTVMYRIDRNGALMDVQILILKSISLRYLAAFIYGLGFMLVGLIVVLVKPLGHLQRAFGRYSILSMLFFGLSELSIGTTDQAWRSILLANAFILATILALPEFVRFYFLFPVHRPLYGRRSLTVTLYALSSIIGVIIASSVLWPAARPLTPFLANFRYAFYITGLAIFIRSYFRYVRPERRRALRPILIAVAIAILTFSYALAVTAINPFAAFIDPTIVLPVMLIVVVPVLFGYAIFRYGLMDIDFLLQRTLTYGAVTTLMAMIYLVVVYGIGSMLTYFFGSGDDRLMHIAALVVIAAAFEPIKTRLQQSVDRMFYRERYDYQQALRELSEELPQLLDVRQVLDALVNRISSTMHVARIAAIVCDDLEGCQSVGRNMSDADCTFTDSDRSLQALHRKMHKPLDFHLLEEGLDEYDLGKEELRKLANAGVVLSVPMFLKKRLVGFINVGPKMSGRVYAQEDVNLLATVAAQAAVAIENARLHRSEREKERIREELALAREIQRGLLPKGNPVFGGLDASGVSIPASSVGGDYYDFIPLSPKRMLVVVADVSGKGMSAALYMSKIQGMVQLAAHMYRSPKEMLVHINRRIFEGMDRRSFITMVLALFDMSKNEVRICRAGHTKALVGDGGKLRFLEGSGIALGLERGPVFEEQIEEVRMRIRPGSLFLFYTDGITETMNAKMEQMGEERMARVLRAVHDRSAADVQKAVLDAVEQFRDQAEQHDDLTMAVVKGTERPRRKR